MTVEAFGTMASGEMVERITLRDGDLSVGILTLGAILQDLRFGSGPGLTAGSDRLVDYADGPLAYAGAVVGPVANRIGGARVSLDGAELSFDANAAGGHHLHGGATGLHGLVWSVVERSESTVDLRLELAAGFGGYPGNRMAEARYEVEHDRLRLTLSAKSDAPTLWAAANHSYWTLADRLEDLSLEIAAGEYLPTDEHVLPTGEIAPVEGTRFDFRAGRQLGEADRLDTCFCLSSSDQPLSRVAQVTAPETRLEMWTTTPGLQVFTADPFTDPGMLGHDGRRYGPRFGLALEAQGWPDAPNNAHFPSVRLDPGQPWSQVTEWRFG